MKCLSNLCTQQNTALVFCQLNTPISVFTFCYSAVDYIYDCVIDSFQYFRVLLTLKLISNGASIQVGFSFPLLFFLYSRERAKLAVEFTLVARSIRKPLSYGKLARYVYWHRIHLYI